MKAIEKSQVALLVFSKNYATSSWCLSELVKIMECKEKNQQKVIPIFYHVDPSDVRYQHNSFAEAFIKHELRFKDDVEGMQKVQGWKTALTDAADLNGCHIRDGIESDCIQDIVDQVSSKLCKASISFLPNIVGINTHLEKVNSTLEMEVNDVQMVGIWGMGGVGKTTIARAIFDKLSPQFDGACFLADIKENKGGLHSLQNILLSELLRKKDDYVHNKEDGKHMIARRLRFKKVFIVLDDIDHRDHLDYLAGDLSWFDKGSRIIATTRDKHLIGRNDVIYEVTPLLKHDAIKLFHQYAFKEEVPGEHFKELSLDVIDHAKGLPLALKVWGSLLHKRDITEWRSAIEQMKITSNSEIVEKLKISYDGLETIQQDMFLDIACFFRGMAKDYIMPILESCYSGATNIGLSVLIDKSLVFISKYCTIQMHDLIQDMGKYIVNLRKNPRERSRLWDVQDIEEVMDHNTGTMAVEVIWFYYEGQCWFRKDAMKNMQMLRILYIKSYSAEGVDDLEESDGSIDYLPNNLCCFAWHGYPWKLLPQNFNLTRLVHIHLQQSSLHHLWNETKQLPSLRKLDISSSKSLKSTPDFTGMPNLEYLDLRYCTSLEEVHDSLRCSRKLITLDLYDCKSLERFPYVNVESLEYLDIEGCSSLKKLPEFFGIMKSELEIEMQFSGIREMPSSIILPQWSDHTELYLHNMHDLVSLPSSICELKDLMKLNVSNCSKLETLPEGIGDLEKLEELNLSGNNFEHLPQSIAQLGALQSLDLSYCKKLKELPEFPPQLGTICADWHNDWICTSLFQNMSSLQHDISASDSLSLRVFKSGWWDMNIPSWFHHRGTGRSVSVNLSENWYVSDNFLGFAICYSGKLNNDITAHLIRLGDGASLMTKKFVLSESPSFDPIFGIKFFVIPLAVLWDASKANGKTPNVYGCFRLVSTREMIEFGVERNFGVRLLYKDEVQIGMRRSRDEEGSCSSSKKQRPLLQLFPTSPGL